MKQVNGITFLTSTVFLAALFVLVLLTSCVPVRKKTDSIDPIRNTQEFGRAIGCVMAPNTCTPKQQDEQKFLKEFERIDQELNNKK